MKEKQHNKGSATVEACIVVPLFLFFLLGILYMLMMIMADAHIHQSLSEAAIYEAQQSYFEDRMIMSSKTADLSSEKENTIITNVLNDAVINRQFRTYLGDDHMVDKVVVGGVNGILVTVIPDKHNPKIFDIRADYFVKITVPILGTHQAKRSDYIRQKAFLGYSYEEFLPDSDIYVYITPNQSVYHVSRNCTHLSLNVRSYTGNCDYPPCSFCGRERDKGVIYIAENGNVYHNNLHCMGLKRTVSRVKKSSVPNLKPCSRCGK